MVHNLTGWLSEGMQRILSERMQVFFLAFVTGILAGTAAFILKWMIGGVSSYLTGHFHPGGGNWAFLIIPIFGVVFAALFQRYIARREIYHGVDRLNNSLRAGKYKMPFQLTFTPMFAATLTLGFGGSAGSEGPIAYTGAALGSNVGRSCRMNPQMMKILVACGAAAGIAGIFKAPLGGAFFALECLAVELSSVAIIGLMIASITSGLTAFVLSGCTPDIYFSQPSVFDWHLMPFVLLLGLFGGLYSLYYATVMTKMNRFYAALKNHWVRNILAGSVIGLAIFIFPPLYGEGYGFISNLLADKIGALTPYSLFAGDTVNVTLILLMLGGMMAVKAFATSSATSGGGVAGDFAPALFAGCITGWFFAEVLNASFAVHLPAGMFAFMGMSAVMAATQRAPLMAIFLTVEMGAAYRLMLPVVVVATISFLTFKIVHNLIGKHEADKGVQSSQ